MVKKKIAKCVVLDTNTLVPALLFRGRLSAMVDLWKMGAIKPVFSKDTFAEFKAVLEYPKFSLTAQERRALIEEEVLPYFDVVTPKHQINGVCRDPDDDIFLSCAMAASAEYIVTGDKDLLDIGRYKNVKIINFAEFLKRYSL